MWTDIRTNCSSRAATEENIQVSDASNSKSGVFIEIVAINANCHFSGSRGVRRVMGMMWHNDWRWRIAMQMMITTHDDESINQLRPTNSHGAKCLRKQHRFVSSCVARPFFHNSINPCNDEIRERYMWIGCRMPHTHTLGRCWVINR